jgi:hypothetical protein
MPHHPAGRSSVNAANSGSGRRHRLRSEAINGAARRRTKAAHAHRRNTSGDGAHHLVTGARRRRHPRSPATDRPGRTRRSAPSSREPGQGRDLQYAAARRLLARLHVPTPWARGLELRGAVVGRPPTIMLCIRILRLSLLAEERMRGPTVPPAVLSLSLLCFCFFIRRCLNSVILISCMIFIYFNDKGMLFILDCS